MIRQILGVILFLAMLAAGVASLMFGFEIWWNGPNSQGSGIVIWLLLFGGSFLAATASVALAEDFVSYLAAKRE